MKLFNRVSLALLAAVLILVLFIPSKSYAEGRILPKYYKEMIEGECLDDIICIYDCSWSMNNTFSYEKELIKYNLSETEFEKNFNLETSTLWSELNAISSNYSTIVLVSDLWNTSAETLTSASNMMLAVFVPFWSNDEEAINHIEDVVWEEILSYWTDSTVVIIYLDGFTDLYDNEKLKEN